MKDCEWTARSCWAISWARSKKESLGLLRFHRARRQLGREADRGLRAILALAVGTYSGTITITGGGVTDHLAVSFVISSSGGGSSGSTGYKLFGWNDLGMHCQDGKDSICAYVVDGSGNLVT